MLVVGIDPSSAPVLIRYDHLSGAVNGRIKLPAVGHSVAVTPDHRYAFVSLQFVAAVAMVDLQANAVVAHIAVGPEPTQVTITPDGREVFVSHERDKFVAVIDVAGRRLTRKFGVMAEGIAFTPDGAEVFLAGGIYGDSTVHVYRTSDLTPITTVAKLGCRVVNVTMSPRGDFAAVTADRCDQVFIVSTATRSVTGVISAKNPWSSVVTSDGSTLYVSEPAAGRIEAFNVTTGKLLASISVGSGPHELVITPDDRSIYVTNFNDNTTVLVDVATNSVVRKLSGFSRPVGVALVPAVPAWTPVGADVVVRPVDTTTGKAAAAEITFSKVSTAGQTTVTSALIGGSGSPAAPLSTEFSLGQPSTYYGIATKATFSGPVTVCIDYAGASYGNESLLKLLQFENGAWIDITTSADPSTRTVCGISGSLSLFMVAEQNAAPVLSSIALPAGPVPVNTSTSLTATFTDPNPTDRHTAIIDWEDGSTAGTVTEMNGAGHVSGSRVYTAAGVYTVQVTVADDGLSDVRTSAADVPAYIVVYDPSVGFVTGGGWIASPPGACYWNGCNPDGTTVGKATFGFVSRYQRGAATPSGQTEFHFTAGNLQFTSTAYEWLVVAGARAQYKGYGSIKGDTRTFGFLITAVDGAIAGGGGVDKFRMKIWDKLSGNVVYDNQIGQAEDSDASTAIGGGSIVIHK